MRLLTLAALVAIAAVSARPAGAAEAWSLEVSGVSYDEECLLYTLQGLVNRDAPRLFLDTGAIFWQYRPSDQYWMRYLAEKKGFHFTPLGSLSEAITRFRPYLKGVVLYDPARDGSRCVALTLAAQRGLLPVTEAILRRETPALSGSAGWTEDDLSGPLSWRTVGTRTARVEGGLQVTEADAALPYGCIERPAEIDLSRLPFLEVTVDRPTANWALKLNEGTEDDTWIQGETPARGTFRFDLRKLAKRQRGRALIRFFTVGEGSSAVVQAVRFLDAEGQPVPAKRSGGDDCFAAMPIVEDLRGRFPDDASAYRWALEHLMPSCAKDLAFSAGHTHDGTWLGRDPAITIGLDYPIARKAFVFNLSPIGGPWHKDGKPHPGYPEQAALFDEVMRRLNRPAGIYGWAEPEDVYCRRISEDGNFVVCAGAPNLSFWSKVFVAEPPRLHAPPTGARMLGRKYYVVFQTNEGDTPKILAGLMGGAWVSEKRGSAPIAWGINPYLAEHFPALFEFYATTAKASDSFFAGCSGAGYCLPWHLPNLDDYARHAARCLSTYGPNVVDVWESGLRLDQFERYRKSVPVACFTQQSSGPAVNEWLDDGTPILAADHRLFYYSAGGDDPAAKIVGLIGAVAAEREPPFFILCYGGVGPNLPDLVLQVRQQLPADRFEVIGAQEMADLARRAGEVSAKVDSVGVGPGGTVNLEVVLRNPDGRSGGAGQVSWGLPPGWKAAETAWPHGPVPQGTALRHSVVLTAGTTPGRARIACIDDRTGDGRTAGVDVYTETVPVSDFSTTAGWRETGATLSVAGGRGRVSTPGPYASIRRTLTLDFDRGPLLEVRVAQAGGRWAVKVNDGTLADDCYVQADTAATGRFLYDLPAATGWAGRKSFDLILYAVGEGTSFEIDDLKVHYRR